MAVQFDALVRGRINGLDRIQLVNLGRLADQVFRIGIVNDASIDVDAVVLMPLPGSTSLSA